MADHMRRNDKLQALTASASQANARARQDRDEQLERQGRQGRDGRDDLDYRDDRDGRDGYDYRDGLDDRYYQDQQDAHVREQQDAARAAASREAADYANRMFAGRGARGSAGRSTTARGSAGQDASGRAVGRGEGAAARSAQANRRPRGSHASKAAPRSATAASPKKLSLGDFIKQNAVGILSVAAVAILAVLTIMFLKTCGPMGDLTRSGANGASGEAAGASAAYASPYDWTKLQRDNGRYAYVVDGQVKSKLGIDVSESQDAIDWDAVAADGIDFAMIRLGYRGATEGELYLDYYYEANIEGALNAGIPCGIYFFSQAVNVDEAIEEAEFVLDNLGGSSLEYPIAFDSEVVSGVAGARTANLSRDEMTAIADAFCKRLEDAGYSTLVYGNAGDLGRYNDEVVNDGGIWWAEYNVGQPMHYLDIVMWQYANSGVVAGIPTAVDMNIDLSGVLE